MKKIVLYYLLSTENLSSPVLVDSVRFPRGQHQEEHDVLAHAQLDARASGALLHLLRGNPGFSRHFLRRWGPCCRIMAVEVLWRRTVVPINYTSCSLVSRFLWRSIELEDALHWLSTLGGAYSNLGERSLSFALRAGSNALSQMRVVLLSAAPALLDPAVIRRCWLFVAMSRIQTGDLRGAAGIVRAVHWGNSEEARTQGQGQSNGKRRALDPKLDNMCRGIWARLRHARDLERRSKKSRGKTRNSDLASVIS